MSTDDQADVAEFAIVLHAVRERMPFEPTEAERAVIAEHFDYLQALARRGVVRLAGRCLDGGFGIVLLRVESIDGSGGEDEARAIAANDPAVHAGVMTAEVRPFRIALEAEDHDGGVRTQD